MILHRTDSTWKERRRTVHKIMKAALIPAVLLGLTTISAADSSGVSGPKPRLELYDVSELVYQGETFPGKVAIEKPIPEGAVTDEKFALQVRKAVAPGQWDLRKGWSVHCSSGILIVRAPDYVHRLATSYLKGLMKLPLDPD